MKWYIIIFKRCRTYFFWSSEPVFNGDRGPGTALRETDQASRLWPKTNQIKLGVLATCLNDISGESGPCGKTAGMKREAAGQLIAGPGTKQDDASD